MRVCVRLLFAVLFVGVILAFLSTNCLAQTYRIEIPLKNGKTLPAFMFLPQSGVKGRLPAVICGVGVGSQQIPQYHEHCRFLAERNFAVILMDPSNYPENLFPASYPYTWDRGASYMVGSVNQGVVAGRLAISDEWYLASIKATVDYLCCSPLVDPTRIVFSGFSQPANAALTYACRDQRIRAIVWNYGGSPWVMPYNVLQLPPVLIFHGEDDDVYDVKYARKLASELHTNAKYYEAYIYPRQKHMFNFYYDLGSENRFMRPVIQDSFDRLIAFLNRVLETPSRNKKVPPFALQQHFLNPDLAYYPLDAPISGK
ncbi:MAG: dienelactone hydrolase family protein [Desulfomonile tiedjei]|uniref:Dienelactone hydrolase family protein n=1 Tax=Desulfomonile tiedjei TaxID=2358 RepID=A0A9D6UYD2_9BACT|nr:dienelactone hydrolase family protein [Desulfomonile tiedjei]